MEKSKEADRENVGRLFEKKNMQIRQLTTEREQLKAELNIQTEKDKSTSLAMKELVDVNEQMQKEINDLRRKTHENVRLRTKVQTLRDKLKTKNIEEAGRQQEPRRSTPQQKIAPTPLPRRLSAQQQRPKEEQQRRVGTNDTQLNTNGGQMQNCQNENISGKFVFVSFLTDSSFLSSDNVEYIDYLNQNLDSLVHNISSYKKDLLILTLWRDMNTTSGYADYYAKLLSLCKEWKRLRPDGEIHCLYCFEIPESPSEPDKELVSLLLTTCNKYLTTDDASFITAFHQYWPKFANSTLSEKAKEEYPK